MTTKNKKKRPAHSDAGAMPLAGAEAVELYTAEIARKIAALSQQADLLRAEIAESQQLLDEIDEDQSAKAKRPADEPQS